jgi:hypothetical protein
MRADYSTSWTSEPIGFALTRWNASNFVGTAFLIVWPLLRVSG